MLALGAMLFMIARTMPRITEDGPVEAKPTIVERLVMSDIPHRVDAVVSTASGKLFRRIKIVLMRVDHHLTERLKGMSERSKEEDKIDFNDIAEADELIAKDKDLKQNNN
jgi:hypothetical protein